MTPDRLIRQQLTIRLKRLRARIATLTAEAEMIQRMVADSEKFDTIPRLKLRSNSQSKWTVRGQIRSYLTSNQLIAKAQDIFDFIQQYDPSLNPSTFRSHLKRMVDDRTLTKEERGHYRLTIPPEPPEKAEAARLRRQITIRRDR